MQTGKIVSTTLAVVSLAALTSFGCSSSSSGGGGGGGSDGGTSSSGAGGSGGGTCTSTSKPQSSTAGACVVYLAEAGVGTPLSCTLYTGSSFTMSITQSACGMISGALYASTCPTAGLVGECLTECGTENENVGYFYEGTAAAVQQDCGGTFIAPP